MPIVQIQMLEGRTEGEKKMLMERVCDAVSETLNVNKDMVRIIITEVPKRNWSVGGRPLSEKD